MIRTTRRVKSITRSRITLAALIGSALADCRTPEAKDVCLHFGIAWRALTPAADGRLHATCACGTTVTRSAFVDGGRS
jgi:hypothetical protein